MKCRIHDCNRPAETEDEYGLLCLACADALELADREEYEAAAEEAILLDSEPAEG